MSANVTVNFKDGTKEDFTAQQSYDTCCDGRMVIWKDVRLNNVSMDYYSVPLDNIKSIEEKEWDD